MAHPMHQPIVRELSDQGWTVELTRTNHIKATHPDAIRPIFLPGTPGSTAQRQADPDSRLVTPVLLTREAEDD